jgi:hypothetical protein
MVAHTRQTLSGLQVGTPLTHRHFLRRAMGTYGPGIKAGEGTFPGPKTPIPGEDAACMLVHASQCPRQSLCAWPQSQV